MSMHERLKQARLAAGYKSARRFVESHPDLTYPTYNPHENGTRGITRQAAERYSELLNVSASWLLFGEESNVTPISAQGVAPYATSNLASVPLYDAEASAGQGAALKDGEASGKLLVPKEDLKRATNGDKSCVAISIRGDSMAPTLLDGDKVVVDTLDTEPKPRLAGTPKIYILDSEALLYAKRVAIDAQKRFVVSSDNSEFETEYHDRTSARIIGRVIHLIREL